jgi:hypothetical protein
MVQSGLVLWGTRLPGGLSSTAHRDRGGEVAAGSYDPKVT